MHGKGCNYGLFTSACFGHRRCQSAVEILHTMIAAEAFTSMNSQYDKDCCSRIKQLDLSRERA